MNNLKLWHHEQVIVQRIVVATDDLPECVSEKLVLKGEELSVCRQEELDAVLTWFESVFSDDPGSTGTVTHNISTTTETPIHSHLYRLWPKWRDQVKNELDSLLRSGIIKESTSPWASPIVPVRKSDGSLRLCVDFRKLNSITNLTLSTCHWSKRSSTSWVKQPFCLRLTFPKGSTK